MRAFKNYNEVKEYTETVKLPAGAYKVKLIKAEEREFSGDKSALCIVFDIDGGEYDNYYHEKYENDKKSYDNAKYKGVIQLWYPNGGKYDEGSEKKMKTALKNIVESNNLNVDFTKEWDGAVFKGCTVGMIFREEEYDYNGHSGMTAKPFSIISLEDLKNGKYNIPKPKYLNGGTAPKSSATSSTDYDNMPLDEDLPF